MRWIFNYRNYCKFTDHSASERIFWQEAELTKTDRATRYASWNQLHYGTTVWTVRTSRARSDTSPVTTVWTAAHHRTCRTTASPSQVQTLDGIGVLPTGVIYLQYRVSGSTLTNVGLFYSLVPRSGTLSARFYLRPDDQRCFRRLRQLNLIAQC